MDKIKCLIIDDEPVAQRILEGYLSDLPEFELVGKCLNALSARSLLQDQEIDLMFLDIEMPKLKGISFLKTLHNPPKVIITTAHRKYALEGYELEVVDYLLKPIPFERFLKAINRFKKLHSPNELKEENKREHLYVKSDRKTLKIKQDAILYIEGMNNYIKIYCHGDKIHTVYSSINSMLEKLGPQFVRIHKSYVVNSDNISSFTRELIEISEKELPVGRAFREAINKL